MGYALRANAIPQDAEAAENTTTKSAKRIVYIGEHKNQKSELRKNYEKTHRTFLICLN